ncbi:tetratricopeptide repeat protein, partial [bacterium]|nr:tetratricopeptide repeat protein [bacterium]
MKTIKGVIHLRSAIKFISVVPLCLYLNCASTQNPRIDSNQESIDNLRRELVFLKEQNSQLRREIEELKKPFSDQNLEIKQNRADFATQLNEISQRLEVLQSQIEDTNYRFTSFIERNQKMPARHPVSDGLTSKPDSTVADSSATTLETPNGVDRSREIYNTAYRDLNRGNYQLALQSFRQFLQQYPNTDLSDNAQYWIGEILYDQGRFTNAIEEFEKV